MKTIKVGTATMNVEFSFNSFRYMQDFDMGKFAEMGDKPFMIIGIIEDLLRGALNHDRKVIVTDDELMDITEEIVTSGGTTDVLETLMSALEESDFFKSLQAK